MAKIFSIEQLTAFLKAAKSKAGGQYVTLYCESDYRMNKFPTDGSERVRIKDDFQPRKRYTIKYHFGEDYDKKMSKLLGVDYKSSDDNREHLVENVLMRFKSTGTACFIAMPEARKSLGVYLNGQPISEEDLAYAKRYKAKSNPSMYLNIGVKNVYEIHIGGEIHECLIGKAAEVSDAG
jgi:hypothetical protein